MNDFGSNPAATAGSKRAKQTENHGIVTIELANGKRLDGYVLLSEKNLAKMGLTVEQAKAMGNVAKSTSGAKLHIQFGDRPVELAEAITFD